MEEVLVRAYLTGVYRIYYFEPLFITNGVKNNFNLSLQQVRPQAEEMAGQDIQEFKPISYKTQVVTGTNFFIKVSQERSK